MKKITVDVTVRLTIRMDEDASLEDVINEMDYSFEPCNDGEADLIDSEITQFVVIDSR